MTARAPKPLPPPTLAEREQARAAAAALRGAIADPRTMGARIVAHIDLSRPRRAMWLETWANLPGFSRINGGSYRHACLPGWEYARGEIRSEMIPDLEALAERGVRPREGRADGPHRRSALGIDGRISRTGQQVMSEVAAR